MPDAAASPPPGVDPAAAALTARLRAAGSVFAEDEAALLATEARDAAELESMALRRIAGDPLEQIVGWAEFGRLRIALEPGVFVPRRRTELLAELAASYARPGMEVVELCCGAAAIAAVVQATVPGAHIVAADVEEPAVRAARRNLRPPARVVQGDLYEPLPPELRGRIGLLAANTPYVPSDEIRNMPPEARDHEPLVTLDGGADGLEVQRRIVADAPEWLAPDGVLLIETSLGQAPRTMALLVRAGLNATVRRDPERAATVVVGTRPA